jgi:hypothetical protein
LNSKQDLAEMQSFGYERHQSSNIDENLNKLTDDVSSEDGLALSKI